MIDVAIVGAGAAGLAAAARLRRHGLDTHIFEATIRPGGRARSAHPALLGGAWLDEGAAWLHAPDRNPLVALARQQGIALVEAFSGRARQLFADGRRATAADEHAYGQAESSWHDLVLSQASTDRSLAEAAGRLRHEDRWAANVEHWEATIIAAADPDALGVADWHANELPWGDLQPEQGGLGDLVTALLTRDAGPVSYATEVTGIDRTRGDVRLETAGGIVQARAVILTVSTGVLRAETIRHTPPLPDRTRGAIDRLPMGLLSRVVLQARPDATDRLDFDPGQSGLIERRLTRPGEPAMIFTAWPRGEPHLIAFHGGRLAWSLAGDGAAADRMARDELAALYGARRVERLFAPGFHATGWGTDRCFLGAYAYAGPGDFPARAALGEPVDDGRLVIAGEATDSEGLAGTLGGAMRSGERAADAIAAALDRREGRFTPAPKPV